MVCMQTVLFYLFDQAEIKYTYITFQAEKEYFIFKGGLRWMFGHLNDMSIILTTHKYSRILMYSQLIIFGESFLVPPG